MAVELDELDLRIVALLLKDGRTPTAQIAEQIGGTPESVRKKFERAVARVLDELGLDE